MIWRLNNVGLFIKSPAFPWEASLWTLETDKSSSQSEWEMRQHRADIKCGFGSKCKIVFTLIIIRLKPDNCVPLSVISISLIKCCWEDLMPGNDDNCLKMLQHQHEAALSCKKHFNNLDKTTTKRLLNQTYQAKFMKQNQTYQNHLTQTNLTTTLIKPNIPNQT